ncbi:MAG: phosphoglycerate kinase, partial [candidate division Zixibacteria bacterium]|nr:phosphoglycerate kinase [candidate division Zixibacteria bacterium]
NTRRYEIERIMWKLRPADFDSVVRPLYSLATEIYENVSSVLINEALAASNFDFSSSILPLVMDKVALGFHINTELRKHVTGAREATLVVFSGIKIDKLDDLENIIDRGKLRMIISAGSVAMALKKAQAQLDGGDFHIGLAQEDENAMSYISTKRIEQAKRIIRKCNNSEINVVLPIDFVLDDGTVSGEIPENRLQFDIGPKTRVLFSLKLDEFANSGENLAMFYNGVFGKFEDERFANGTKAFIGELRSLTERGVRTYVGGGEGRMALLKYGKLEDVTHAFNAGGTILKSLGNKHIAYLKAGYLSNAT